MSFLQIAEIWPNEQWERTYKTAEDVCQAIYAGTYKSNCLIPVRAGPFQEILGTAVWVCHDERMAEQKRDAAELVFTVREFMLIVEAARDGEDALSGIIKAKRTFGGRIEDAIA